jgi:hypothetical protein
MKISQTQYIENQWSNISLTKGFEPAKAQLVLAFGSGHLVTDPELFGYIRGLYPAASIVSASTAGEIAGETVCDNSIVVTALELEATTIRCCSTNINEHGCSYSTGRHLMKELSSAGLSAIFIISDGNFINGSELASGFAENNPGKIPVTGGLAGDGPRFSHTFAGLDQLPGEGNVVAVGFYGTRIRVGHGSFSGWDEFGPERTITRSDKNTVYEIDDKLALDLYKEYLGPYKDELPGSALLFPLSLKEPGSGGLLVRTILSIDENEGSMRFAGNLPQGSKVRLMKGSFDRLIEGSSTAAKNTILCADEIGPELAILVSCVGRKLILQDRTDEEVQAVQQIFGEQTCLAGFYSYGEISPFNPASHCELHNQTMTITTFSEF